MNSKDIIQKDLIKSKSYGFWQVVFPFLVLLIVIFFSGIWLISNIKSRGLSIGIWLNISIILVAFPLFIMGLLILIILIACIFGLSKMNQLILRFLKNVNKFIETPFRITNGILKALPKPVLLIEVLTKSLFHKKSDN